MSTRRKSNLRVARQFKEGRYLIVVLLHFSKSNQSYIRVWKNDYFLENIINSQNVSISIFTFELVNDEKVSRIIHETQRFIST